MIQRWWDRSMESRQASEGKEIRLSGLVMDAVNAVRGGFAVADKAAQGQLDINDPAHRETAIKALTSAATVLNPITPASRYALAVPSAVAPATNEVVKAGETLGLGVPRAIASDGLLGPRIAQGLRNVPYVGDKVQTAGRDLVSGLGAAALKTADEFGTATGPNAANRVGQFLEGQAQAEIAANAAAAAKQTQALESAALRSRQAQEQALAGSVGVERTAAANLEQKARQAAASRVGELDPQVMGQRVTEGIRKAEERARGIKERAYQTAGEMDATINADAVANVRSRVQQGIADEGRVIDGQLTPAASRMLTEVENLARFNIENRAPGAALPSAGDQAIAGISIQGIEQVRKRLNSIAQAASNDADRSAAGLVKRKFDEWLDDAVDSALFSGSKDALDAIKHARAANADWRSRFGYNGKTDADKILNKIVNGDVTTNEVSNWVVGASKVGASGSSARLLDSIAAASPDVLPAIKSGIWTRLSQTADGVADKAGPRVANDIFEFLNGSGKPVASKLFNENERAVMQSYATAMRQAEAMRASALAAERQGLPAAAKTKPIERAVGEMEQLAQSVMGRGRPTDEALFSAIDGYAKGSAKGDIETLGHLWRVLPENLKGEMAGAIARNLGRSPRTGEWSPDVFLSQWNSYSPQAKTILFGNAGQQRAAWDAMATIAAARKDTLAAFGNPSGTAQQLTGYSLAGTLSAAGAAAVAGNYIPALTALTSIIGGKAAASYLAAPATAPRIARWASAYEMAKRNPAPSTIAAFNRASNNLASALPGGSATAQDLMKALTSRVPAPAEDNSNRPENDKSRKQN